MNSETYFLVEKLYRELYRDKASPIPVSREVRELHDKIDRAGLRLVRKEVKPWVVVEEQAEFDGDLIITNAFGLFSSLISALEFTRGQKSGIFTELELEHPKNRGR